MGVRSVLQRTNDGFFRGAALREARARLVAVTDRQARALRQATLLMEVGARVGRPVEALPDGSRPAVLMTLYREAVYWALVAGWTEEGEAPADLRSLWSLSSERLARTGLDETVLDRVRDRLLENPGGTYSLDTYPEDVAKVRSVGEALLSELAAPRQRVDRVLGQRFLRFVLVLAVLAGIVVGLRALSKGPNLLENKPFKTSSSWSGCAADPPCTALLFHTEHENAPWVEFDMEASKPIHRIEVTNRSDCCSDRAVPLIAEISEDHVHWTEVGQRDKDFTTWTLKLKPERRARYLRLRVPRQTALHFVSVAVR